MLSCLLIEDEPGSRFLLKTALKQCGYRVEAPETAIDLSQTFASGVQFMLVAFDGCLWDGQSWLELVPDIRRCLAQDGRLICVSAGALVADVASRLFRFPVDHAGKDPDMLERLLMEPQVVH